jgi:HJR/Mrr/RecB family endonuclease
VETFFQDGDCGCHLFYCLQLTYITSMIEYFGYPMIGPERDPRLIGRKEELRWLREHLLERVAYPVLVISGNEGVGKSTLVHHLYSEEREEGETLWLDLAASGKDAHVDLENVLIRLDRGEFSYEDKLHIVLDGAEVWGNEKLDRITARLLNYKVVKSLVIVRQPSVTSGRTREFHIDPLTPADAAEMLKSLLIVPSDDTFLKTAIRSTAGYPLMITTLALMINTNGGNIQSLAEGRIYTLDSQIILPEKEIKSLVLPIVQDTGKKIISSLQKQPQQIYQVSPLQFEEILAELLLDMGYDIELTSQTRDGGMDILAYKHTPMGKLLFLVEAKRYRQDRKVGIDLVKNLYATLMHQKANLAMLVTTSSFTKDARAFEK